MTALRLDGDLLARGSVGRDEFDVLPAAQLLVLVEEADAAVEPCEDRRDRDLVTRPLELLRVP